MRALLAVTIVAAAATAHAAGGICTLDTDCTAPQVCRLAEHTCAWEATDAATLVDAINGANADTAADVICIGAANPPAAVGDCANDPIDPTCTHIGLDTSVFDDPAFGPTSLPVITTPVTVEGCGADPSFSVLDANGDVRMFLVRPDPIKDVQPSLTLIGLTILEARPGPNTAGDVVGGGAVHVTDVATTTGLLSTLTVNGVVFVNGGTTSAVGEATVSLAGGDATFTNCTFDGNVGNVAGGILSSATGRVRVIGGTFTNNHSDSGVGGIAVSTDIAITSTEFQNNSGAVGGVDVTAATRDDGTGTLVPVKVDITAATFDGNHGDITGGVRSLGDITLSNDVFTSNRADAGDSVGGAVLARDLTIENGNYDDNFASAGGGAVAVLDVPPSGPVSIAGAEFSRNSTDATGGAVLATGATITIDAASFDSNTAAAGGAVYFKDLQDRNGAATPDATVTGTVFIANLATPAVTITQGDATVDELGNDTGLIGIVAIATGSAVVVDGAGSVTVSSSCIIGNGRDAMSGLNAGAINAASNWWGDATGAGPVGKGDFVPAAVSASSPLTAAPAACSSSPRSGYPQVFVGATVTTDSAQLGVDYRLIDHATGIDALQSATGQIIPHLHEGAIQIDVVGINDTLVEGDETFTFTMPACVGACGYTLAGQNIIAMTITDNGDGAGEGEGEGEGGCDEKLTVTPSTVVLADNGKPSSAPLSVKNDSACDVQLFSPFVQKGASQGFAVNPVAQKSLALAPGASLALTVTFTPPTDKTDTPPVGTLVLETAAGTIKQVPLSTAAGCSCSSSRTGPAESGLVVASALVLLVVRRRRGGA